MNDSELDWCPVKEVRNRYIGERKEICNTEDDVKFICVDNSKLWTKLESKRKCPSKRPNFIWENISKTANTTASPSKSIVIESIEIRSKPPSIETNFSKNFKLPKRRGKENLEVGETNDSEEKEISSVFLDLYEETNIPNQRSKNVDPLSMMDSSTNKEICQNAHENTSPNFENNLPSSSGARLSRNDVGALSENNRETYPEIQDNQTRSERSTKTFCKSMVGIEKSVQTEILPEEKVTKRVRSLTRKASTSDKSVKGNAKEEFGDKRREKSKDYIRDWRKTNLRSKVSQSTNSRGAKTTSKRKESSLETKQTGGAKSEGRHPVSPTKRFKANGIKELGGANDVCCKKVSESQESSKKVHRQKQSLEEVKKFIASQKAKRKREKIDLERRRQEEKKAIEERLTELSNFRRRKISEKVARTKTAKQSESSSRMIPSGSKTENDCSVTKVDRVVVDSQSDSPENCPLEEQSEGRREMRGTVPVIGQKGTSNTRSSHSVDCINESNVYTASKPLTDCPEKVLELDSSRTNDDDESIKNVKKLLSGITVRESLSEDVTKNRKEWIKSLDAMTKKVSQTIQREEKNLLTKKNIQCTSDIGLKDLSLSVDSKIDSVESNIESLSVEDLIKKMKAVLSKSKTTSNKNRSKKPSSRDRGLRKFDSSALTGSDPKKKRENLNDSFDINAALKPLRASLGEDQFPSASLLEGLPPLTPLDTSSVPYLITESSRPDDGAARNESFGMGKRANLASAVNDLEPFRFVESWSINNNDARLMSSTNGEERRLPTSLNHRMNTSISDRPNIPQAHFLAFSSFSEGGEKPCNDYEKASSSRDSPRELRNRTTKQDAFTHGKNLESNLPTFIQPFYELSTTRDVDRFISSYSADVGKTVVKGDTLECRVPRLTTNKQSVYDNKETQTRFTTAKFKDDRKSKSGKISQSSEEKEVDLKMFRKGNQDVPLNSYSVSFEKDAEISKDFEVSQPVISPKHSQSDSIGKDNSDKKHLSDVYDFHAPDTHNTTSRSEVSPLPPSSRSLTQYPLLDVSTTTPTKRTTQGAVPTSFRHHLSPSTLSSRFNAELLYQDTLSSALSHLEDLQNLRNLSRVEEKSFQYLQAFKTTQSQKANLGEKVEVLRRENEELKADRRVELLRLNSRGTQVAFRNRDSVTAGNREYSGDQDEIDLAQFSIKRDRVHPYPTTQPELSGEKMGNLSSKISPNFNSEDVVSSTKIHDSSEYSNDFSGGHSDTSRSVSGLNKPRLRTPTSAVPSAFFTSSNRPSPLLAPSRSTTASQSAQEVKTDSQIPVYSSTYKNRDGGESDQTEQQSIREEVMSVISTVSSAIKSIHQDSNPTDSANELRELTEGHETQQPPKSGGRLSNSVSSSPSSEIPTSVASSCLPPGRSGDGVMTTSVSSTINEAIIDSRSSRSKMDTSATYSESFEPDTQTSDASNQSSVNSKAIEPETQSQQSSSTPLEQMQKQLLDLSNQTPPNLFSSSKKPKHSALQVTLKYLESLQREEDARLNHQKAIFKTQEQLLVEEAKSKLSTLSAEGGVNVRKKQRAILVQLREQKNHLKRLVEMQNGAAQEKRAALSQLYQLLSSTSNPSNLVSGRVLSSRGQSPVTSKLMDTSMSSSDDLESFAGRVSSLSCGKGFTKPRLQTLSGQEVSFVDQETKPYLDEDKENKALKTVPSPRRDECGSRVKRTKDPLLPPSNSFSQTSQQTSGQRSEDIVTSIEEAEDRRRSSSVYTVEEKGASDSQPMSITEDSIPEEIPDGGSSNVRTDSSSTARTKDQQEQLSQTESPEEEICLKYFAKDKNIPSVEHSRMMSDSSVVNGSKMSAATTGAITTTSSSDKQHSTSTESKKRKNVSPSVPFSLKFPLSPRTHLPRRRVSSESDDSFTMSQNETASDVSDGEGKLIALREELAFRKSEAEKLKKEKRRLKRERYASQEEALRKQIEIYDDYIKKTKLEIEENAHELQRISTVKPLIKRPRVKQQKSLDHSMTSENASDVTEDGSSRLSEVVLSTSTKQQHQQMRSSSTKSIEEEIVLDQTSSGKSTENASPNQTSESVNNKTDQSISEPTLSNDNSSDKTELENEKTQSDLESSSIEEAVPTQAGDTTFSSQYTLDGEALSKGVHETDVSGTFESSTDTILYSPKKLPNSEQVLTAIGEQDLETSSDVCIEKENDNLGFNVLDNSTSGNLNQSSQILTQISSESEDVVSDITTAKTKDVSLPVPVDNNDYNKKFENQLEIFIPSDQRIESDTTSEISEEISSGLAEESTQASTNNNDASPKVGDVFKQPFFDQAHSSSPVQSENSVAVKTPALPSIMKLDAPASPKALSPNSRSKKAHLVADAILKSLVRDSVACVKSLMKSKDKGSSSSGPSSGTSGERSPAVNEMDVTKDAVKFDGQSSGQSALLASCDKTEEQQQNSSIFTLKKAASDISNAESQDVEPHVRINSPVDEGGGISLGGFDANELMNRLMTVHHDRQSATDFEQGVPDVNETFQVSSFEGTWLGGEFWTNHENLSSQRDLKEEEELLNAEIARLEELERFKEKFPNLVIREVPDKPPPPYTPPKTPGVMTPTSTSSQSVTAAQSTPKSLPQPQTPANTISVPHRLSKADLRRIASDIAVVVPKSSEEVGKVVSDFVGRLYDSWQGGTAPSDTSLPASLVAPQDDKEVDSCGDSSLEKDDAETRAVFHRLLFHVCRQLVTDIYEVTRSAPLPPYATSSFPHRYKPVGVARHLSRESVIGYVQSEVRALLGLDQSSKRVSTMMRWTQKKKERVDQILVQELQTEESTWTHFDNEESHVKNDLTRQILDSFLEETLNLFENIFRSKI